MHAKVGLDFGELGSWTPVDFNVGPYNVDQQVLSVQSDDLSFGVDLPGGFSLNFAWPNLDTSSAASSTNVVTSAGASNNFFGIGLDVDDLLFTILKLPNPFDVGFDFEVVWGNVEVLDLDLSAGLNFLQDFAMTVSSLTGVIEFEDGTTNTFNFNDDITLTNASSYDADGDGEIEFELTLAPNASLQNDTDLGVNLGFQFDVVKASGGYDFVVDWGI